MFSAIVQISEDGFIPGLECQLFFVFHLSVRWMLVTSHLRPAKQSLVNKKTISIDLNGERVSNPL